MKTKLISTFILICLLATTVVVGLGYPKEVKAQTTNIRGAENLPNVGFVGSATPGLPVTDIGAKIQKVSEMVWNALQKAWKVAGDIFYKNSLRYFLNKVAVDTATYIATGGAGQKPLFVTDWKKYFQQTADEAGGVFFEELTKKRKIKDGYCDSDTNVRCFSDSDCPRSLDNTPGMCMGASGTTWSGLGIDLCEPLTGQVKIDLTVYAQRIIKTQPPRCNWSTVMKNLSDVRNMELANLVDFSTYFRPGGSDLSALFMITSGGKTYMAERTEESKLVSAIEGSFKSVVNPITGAIKTPASMVDNAVNTAFEKSFSVTEGYTGSPVADAIGTFTNTLVSKYLESIFKKGFNPGAEGRAVADNFWTTGGVAAARLYFSELAEVNYIFDVGMQLEDLTVKGEGQFNNVIPNELAQAVEQKCTVGQAMGYYQQTADEYRPECLKLLGEGTDYFGFREDGAEPKVNEGIPYRSILVLRKFRIAPVGWELAAEYYQKYDDKSGRLTLKRLVQEFTNDKSPYYGLVDPEWVLTLPATRCVREGAGPDKNAQDPYCDTLLEDGKCPEGHLVYPFDRVDYCADYESCLKTDSKGRCLASNWGYCVAEKPIWKIKGDECLEKYYASCEEFSKASGGGTGAYLLNTVSGYTDEVCQKDNAGCRAYCTVNQAPFGSQDWQCVPGSEDNKKYLTSAATDCGAGSEGCSLVYASPNKDAKEIETALAAKATANAYGALNKNYIKLAPADYQCQDYTTLIAGFESEGACEGAGHVWREDINACVAGGTNLCRNFTKYCENTTLRDASGKIAPDYNVACKLYTPLVSKEPAVPAVIKPKVCANGSSSCANADVRQWNDECPAECLGFQTYHQSATLLESGRDENLIASSGTTCSEPGCDEFTNLDEVARGGEGIEYKSYLRLCMKPDEPGWKTYYTWVGTEQSGYQLKKWELKSGTDGGPYYLPGGVCTDLNEADCFEFLDLSKGQSNQVAYRRRYANTVSVSDNCHPYRRSRVGSDNASEQSDCQKTFGQWENGACFYQAIPEESIVCQASNKLCREYKPSQAYSSQKILESYFERKDTSGWSGNAAISSESVRRNDYSLKVSGQIEHALYTGDLSVNSGYVLEFLAKSAGGSVNVKASLTGGQTAVNSETIAVSANNWNYYRLKMPRENPSGLTAEEATNNKVIITASGVYLDNLVLKRLDSILLLRNSWETPGICNLPAAGSHLGCQTYREGSKNINLRSFNHLCFEDVANCEVVINAKNTKDTADDEKVYLVLNKSFNCSQPMAGCTRVGLISGDAKNSSQYNFSDKYKIIEPNNTLQICEKKEEFCEAYVDPNDKDYYFKDPAGKICEFKKVGSIYGWYQTGTDEFCKDAAVIEGYTAHCLGGRSVKSDNTCTTDADCTNLAYPESTGLCTTWVGRCNSAAAGCQEYQDPAEPEGCDKNLLNYRNGYCQTSGRQCYAAGKSSVGCTGDETCVVNSKEKGGQCNYYYYKNVEECGAGEVNPAKGCVGFKETGAGEAKYKSRGGE